MPKAGLTMVEGTVSQWLVPEGSEVKKGDFVLSYENEKTMIDCECPESGIIHQIAKPGDVVKVGGPLAVIAESAEEYQSILSGSASPAPAAETPAAKDAEADDDCVPFNMPKAGLTMVEGTVTQWLVSEGDEVKKGDLVLNYENEKTTIDCECPESGIIHLIAKPGDVVKVGEPLALIARTQERYQKLLSAPAAARSEAPAAAPAAEAAAAAGSAKAPASDGEWVVASGLARNMAKAHGIDLSRLTGSGPNGRIVSDDVTAYLEAQKNAAPAKTAAAAAAAPVSADADKPTLIPMNALRKAIANNLKHSITTMVQASSSTEFDVTDLFALRQKLVEIKDQIGWKITINDLLVMATVKTLMKHPLLNATFDGETLTSYPHVNINIAVASEAGLAIPVVRNADTMTLLELSKALRDVAVRARDGKLLPGEQSGGSFTVSNVGMYPIDHGGPIANAPQVGLFGFGRPRDRVAKVNGEFVERKMMHVMFTFDHRVFDGLEQGRVMTDLQLYLEHPETMLI